MNEPVKRQIIGSSHSASSTFSPSLRNPHTPKSLVDIPSVPSPVYSYDTKVLANVFDIYFMNKK